jgi:hypothetical protein
LTRPFGEELCGLSRTADDLLPEGLQMKADIFRGNPLAEIIRHFDVPVIKNPG